MVQCACCLGRSWRAGEHPQEQPMPLPGSLPLGATSTWLLPSVVLLDARSSVPTGPRPQLAGVCDLPPQPPAGGVLAVRGEMWHPPQGLLCCLGRWMCSPEGRAGGEHSDFWSLLLTWVSDLLPIASSTALSLILRSYFHGKGPGDGGAVWEGGKGASQGLRCVMYM